MDSNRFDTLVKSLSRSGTRRGLVRLVTALPLAGALATLVGHEVSLADGSGAIVGGGHRRRNRGNTNHHHRRDHGDDTCNRKCGPCKRCKNGSCKKKRDGTVCQGDGVCTHGQCTKGGPAPTPSDPCAGVSCAGGQSCVDNGTCAVSCTEAEGCGGDGAVTCACRDLSAGGTACSNLNDCTCVDACQDCPAGRVCLLDAGKACAAPQLRCCTPCNL